jgi:hypothetical protein
MKATKRTQQTIGVRVLCLGDVMEFSAAVTALKRLSSEAWNCLDRNSIGTAEDVRDKSLARFELIKTASEEFARWLIQTPNVWFIEQLTAELRKTAK